MAGMGPPPKPAHMRARRNRPPTAAVTLPAEGYTGDVPEWPAVVPCELVDIELWATLWRTPQAAAWARMGEGVQRILARYVTLWRSTSDKAPAELRQLEDRFGLNPQAMLRLRWEVAADELADARDGGEGEPPAAGGLRLVAD